MPDMLIRDVPQPTHAELKRRAAAHGVSLQAYVRRLLDEHVAQVTMREWLHTRDRLLPALPDVSGAEVIRAAREELR